MKRLSRLVLFSALVLAGYSSSSFAANYLFLKGTPAPGDVPGINTPGSLVVPATVFATGSDLTFPIPQPVTSQVFLLKPGTVGLPNECLDQGNQNRVGYGANAVGAPVTINSTTPLGYTLTLSVDASATASSCNPSNPAPIRVASISGPNVSWNGTYDVYQTNSVPEPGSLALVGLGLSALVLVGRGKAKRT